MNKTEGMKSGHGPHSNFQMSLVQNSLGKIFNFVFLFIGGVFWNINDKLNQSVESKRTKMNALTRRHKESSLKCHQELRALHPSTGLVGKEQPLFRRAWNPLCHLDLSWPIKFFSDMFFTCQVCLWGPQWEENVLLTSLQAGSPGKIDSSSASHWQRFIGCFSSSFWSKALSNGTQWNDWLYTILYLNRFLKRMQILTQWNSWSLNPPPSLATTCTLWTPWEEEHFKIYKYKLWWKAQKQMPGKSM